MKEYKVSIKQNLIDCGLSISTIDCFLSCEDKDCKIMYLEKVREGMIEDIHDKYCKIDCLDYLINKIKKE